ncbi:MAG: putative universal stress protein [Gemmatimonadetes bacterium]|nr:putative universal stress protein [Gemmatimonadota bacterium]
MTQTIERPHADSPYLVAQPQPVDDTRRNAIVLMATDGTERSDGALRVAAARARATGATLELMTVIQSEPVIATENMYFGEVEGLRRWTMRRKEVEEQIARVLGPDVILSVTVLDGNAAFTISRVAIERRAALAVVGLGRHDMAHRIFSDETALQLARIARVPVLAVPASAALPPQHAVVAIDFSDIATRAAQTAIAAVADDGIVELVHVLPTSQSLTLGAERSYEDWATQQLGGVAARLIVPEGVTVKLAVMRGSPASQLLDYAKRVGADVISTGTHGRGFVARAIVGSVTAQLMRGATCSLLTVPRDPLPALAPSARARSAGESFESPMAWSRLLSDFSKRNAGRRTILEVDDLELGAQAQEYNWPLLGTSYSERDGRVDLMLGDRAAGGRHLSRSIGSVTAVDVLTDGAGHDVALRVQHGTGQTLLTFAA